MKTVDTTLFGLLERAVEAFPERDALVFPEVRLTYRELAERVEHRTRTLASLGVAPGEHVGTIMPNGPDTIELLLAISALGAVPVPFNPRYRGEELAYVVDHADVVTLLVRGEVAEGLDFAERLSQALPELEQVVDPTALELEAAPALRRIALLGEGERAGMLSSHHLDRSAAAVGPRPLERPDTGDVGLMMYTSGTTARPKGALLSHRPFVLGGQALADRYELTSNDRLFDPLPLFHMAGILGLAASLSRGASFLCMSKIEGGASLEMLVEERATVAFVGFPTLALSMIEHHDFDAGRLTDLRVMHTHGLPEVLRKIQRALPDAVVQNPYGCTEAGGLVSLSELSDSLDDRVTYSGRPYPGVEVSVVAPTGDHLGAGELGELVVRGWSLFEGYYRNPDATAAVVDDDGWFHTGDLGELDAEGRIKYVSRLKDMLKVGGENVAAAEIEDMMSEHPAVSVVQVIGIPDERLDEVPAAFVELVPGADATEGELLAFCDGRIASFKVPRLVRIVDSWPMSATKIQKFRLKEGLLAELAVDAGA